LPGFHASATAAVGIPKKLLLFGGLLGGFFLCWHRLLQLGFGFHSLGATGLLANWHTVPPLGSLLWDEHENLCFLDPDASDYRNTLC
jgi:hypothetical protein